MSKKRLWDKGKKINELVEKFTIGNDPELDQHLLLYDITASKAHAKMLAEIKLLTSKEAKALMTELNMLAEVVKKGEFTIPYELEDSHSAIEAHLVGVLGDIGKKIHTGRSRNDQVLVAMRLYLRKQVCETLLQIDNFIEALVFLIKKEGTLCMPGYTHLQRAMPSSVGMWAGAFAEHCLELCKIGLDLFNSINENPLGVASGFGVPIPIDRKLTTKLLKFSRTQRNPINVQNSRGRHELRALNWLEEVSGMLEKIAWDLILFSSTEFNFVSLEESFTTGSSIMPQKKNPDVLELIRARASRVRSRRSELSFLIAKLPSNYHRDFQYTKEPVIRAFTDIRASFEIACEVLMTLTWHEECMVNAMDDSIYATYDVYKRICEKGVPFRDAYMQTAEAFESGKMDEKNLDVKWDIINDQCKKEFAEMFLERKEMTLKVAKLQKQCDLSLDF